MGGASCSVEAPPARRLRWRGLGRRRRRRKLPVVQLGKGRCAWRARGLLRRWLAVRWLRRAARRLAAIYMAALAGPPAPAPGASSASCPPWIGLEPCFATPFVANTRACW